MNLPGLAAAFCGWNAIYATLIASQRDLKKLLEDWARFVWVLCWATCGEGLHVLGLFVWWFLMWCICHFHNFSRGASSWGSGFHDLSHDMVFMRNWLPRFLTWHIFVREWLLPWFITYVTRSLRVPGFHGISRDTSLWGSGCFHNNTVFAFRWHLFEGVASMVYHVTVFMRNWPTQFLMWRIFMKEWFITWNNVCYWASIARTISGTYIGFCKFFTNRKFTVMILSAYNLLFFGGWVKDNVHNWLPNQYVHVIEAMTFEVTEP